MTEMAKKRKNQNNPQNRPPEEPGKEISQFPVPHTGLQADPDVLTPEESKDEIDIEIVLENLDPGRSAEDLSEFTDDPDIMEDFAERQQLNTGGEKMLEKLESYNQASPDLSAGDIDAAWDNPSGEETLGGTNPTPDQDVVDYEGLAAGLTYGLEEELNSDKVNERDLNRWELDPRSADDENTAEDVRDLDIHVDENQGSADREDEE
jgi:hypothetical protein